MKNIPMFTGQYGMASLIFREVPWCGRAYIIIRSVWDGKTAAFLEECRQFCRIVGAEEIYASWELEELPAVHAYDMIAMEREKAGLPAPQTQIELEALSRENGERYLDIYNTCFRPVPSAASYDKTDLKRLYGLDTAYLAKVDGQYAGVAEISETGLEGIAVLPEFRGLGYDLALTVLPMVPRKTVQLKTATVNERAIRLYERLGFVRTGVLSRWWKLEK